MYILRRSSPRLARTALLLLTGPALFSGNALANGTQSMDKQLLSGNTASTGEEIEYRISVACSSLTDDCGSLTVDDSIPADLEFVSCQAPVGVTCNTAGAPNIQITKPVFEDGDSFFITIRTRVGYSVAAGTLISNSATSTITAPNAPGNAVITDPAPDVTVQAGVSQWEVRKQRIDPAPPLNPALDTQVRYRVQLCATTGIGNLDLTNTMLVDNFPAGANVDDADGGTIDLGANTITWNIPDAQVSIANLYAGQNPSSEQCISKSVVLTYPNPPFNIGDPVANDADGAAQPVGGVLGPLQEDIATNGDGIGPPTPGMNLSKSAPDVTPGDNLVWTLNANNTSSNVPIDDLIVVDALPLGPAYDLSTITSGQWPSNYGYQVVADIEYSTAGAGGPWTQLVAAHDGTATLSWNSPGDFPVNVSHVRWVFGNTGAGPANQVPRGWSFTTRPRLTQAIPGAAATNGSGNPTNCLSAQFDDGAGGTSTAGPSCDTPNVEIATPAINMSKRRLTANNQPPGADVQYRLRFQHIGGDSTAPTVNPVLADLLPPELEYVSWDSYNGPGVNPNLEIIDDYNGSGRTLLRFSWQGTAPAGSIQIDGSPGTDNPQSFATSDPRGDITFTLRIKAGTPAGSYSNNASFFDNAGGGLNCNSAAADVDDLDGDSDNGETSCVNGASISVINAAVLGGSKWVQGDTTLPIVDDPTSSPAIADALCPVDVDGYTRFPCVAQTQRDTDFNYRLRLENTGNLSLTDYVMYDVLPYVNDTGVGEPLAPFPRDSRWQPVLTGPLVAEDAYTASVGAMIEYSTAAHPCRPEVSSDAQEAPADHWQPGCTDDWGPLPADPATVTAFRIRVAFAAPPYWEPAREMVFRVPMHAPAEVPPSIPGNAAVFSPSWNSFAHRATETAGSTRLNTAEPRKVGIVVPVSYRLGNLVWWDLNNNGNAEAGEAGIGSVTIELWHDNDGTPGPSAGDVQLATTMTDAHGKYEFAYLDAGDYYLVIPDGQAVLNGFLSSSNGEEGDPDSDGDNNDNGTASLAIGGGPNGTASAVVTIGAGASEPTNERLRSNDGSDDDADLFPDPVSNYSVDFGFYLPSAVGTNPVSIGSTVFEDPNDNGLQDPAENGISGVSVELHWTGGDGVMGGGDDILMGSQVTDGSGNYYFGNLAPGSYYVRIPTPPASASISSTPTDQADNQQDGDDNGAQAGGAGAEVISPIIQLSDNGEPGGETEQGGNQDAADDNNGDMTVDFGFLSPAQLAASQVSIGSTVFRDMENNGIQDPADSGISGVQVELYQAGPNGMIGGGDDLFIGTTTTDASGDFLFAGLPQGGYYLRIPTPPTNWELSSGPTSTTDNQTDGDDNGSQNGGIGSEVVSPVIQLTMGAEPVAEGFQGGAQDAADDDNGDMTVDFGFVRGTARPVSIPTMSDYSMLILGLLLLALGYRSGLLQSFGRR